MLMLHMWSSLEDFTECFKAKFVDFPFVIFWDLTNTKRVMNLSMVFHFMLALLSSTTI